MAQIQNLQSIVDDWGNQFAAKYGGVDRSHDGQRGVCYDGRLVMMQPYPDMKTTAAVQNFNYGTVDPSSYKPDVLFHIVVPNEGSKDITTTIKKVSTRSSTNTWSLTIGISLTMEESIKVSAGPVESTSKISCTLSTSTTVGTSVTTTESWEVDSQVVCAPQKTTTIDWILTYADLTVPFTYEVLLTGYVGIWLNNRVDIYGGSNNHNLWFLPISQVFSEKPVANFTVSGNSVIFHGKGTFTGVPGINSTLKSKESPVTANLRAMTTIHPSRVTVTGGDHLLTMDHLGKPLALNPDSHSKAINLLKASLNHEEKKEEHKVDK